MREIVFWLAVCFSCALGACVLCGLLCKAGGKMREAARELWRRGFAFVVMAVVAIIHGGTKNITNRFTADAGLTVTKAELIIPTNGVDRTEFRIEWTGPDTNQEISVRQTASEPWQRFVSQTWEPSGEWWELAARTYANGTNSASWYAGNDYASTTNVTVWAHWHLGGDLPPVELEGEGIALLGFTDTATNVVLTYAVERAVLGDNAGTVRVEVQEGNGAAWMEVRWDAVSGGVTNTVTIPGFWIGKDTRWRVRLEVGQ